MHPNKCSPANSLETLRKRVERYLELHHESRSKDSALLISEPAQGEFFFGDISKPKEIIEKIYEASDRGGVYLFGGMLRDLALYGASGFKSDIDIVVDGNWQACSQYLGSLNARKNKFGGYRISILGQPLDIWDARETWAIKENIVNYEGIESLINTTITNWDAILMDWRTKKFICKPNYIDDINNRALTINLAANPNPIGAAVRVFRHLCLKEARKISIKTIDYLAECAKCFKFENLKKKELSSYGDSYIERSIYDFFLLINSSPGNTTIEKFDHAKKELISQKAHLSQHQLSLDLK